MKKVLLFFSLIIGSGMTITNIYTSIVDASSWGSDIPNSLYVASQYYKSSTPADFFRLFSPICQLSALVSLIVFWKLGKSIRIFLIAALLLYVLADVFAILYFYPRNEIMFTSGTLDVEKLRTAWNEWNSMNWLRSSVLAAGVIFTSLGLHRLYLAEKTSTTA